MNLKFQISDAECKMCILGQILHWNFRSHMSHLGPAFAAGTGFEPPHNVHLNARHGH